MKAILARIILAVWFISPVQSAFGQNLLINGSFELPGFAGSFLDVPSGSTNVPGWTVGSPGGINIIGTRWPASHGTNSIDLRSTAGPGRICQNVLLTSGVTYLLSFDMAFNTDWGLPVAVNVSVGEVSQLFVRPTGSGIPFWQRQSMLISPTNTGTVSVCFEEATDGPPMSPEVAIDHVILEVLPETSLSIRVSQVEICWNTQSNFTYQVQFRSELTTNLWTNLGSPIAGDGQIKCVFDEVLLNDPRRFYQVVQVP